MTFAPVIITTLNRHLHLKRCLDSLANNYFARYTDVYISVDFPPSDQYREGYLKVKELLENYDYSRFKNHYLYFQERNLGPSGNYDFLFNEVKNKCNVFIFTEDDNEFSPCFLEFINECLLKYEDDNNIIAISGCKGLDYKNEKGSNVFVAKLYSAYGVGNWVDKSIKNNKECVDFLLNKSNWTIRNFASLFRKNRVLFNIYVLNILSMNEGLFWRKPGILNCVDSALSIYMHLTKKMCIGPVLSKSRTFGNDGSGVNMKPSKINGLLPIDENKRFSIKEPTSLKFDEQNYKIGEKGLIKISNNLETLKAIIMCCVLLFCGKNRKIVVKAYDFLRKLKLKK